MIDSFIKRRGIALLQVWTVALSVLMISAGCKKDNNQSTSFSITGATSLHFVAGQTKHTEYKAQNIISFEYSELDGWTCSAAKGIITITAPSSGGENSGTITISATTTSSTTLTAKISVAIKNAEDIAGHANSYMVSEPGKRLRFDARIKGNESTASMTSKVDDAVLLWSNPDGVISNVSLENDGHIYFFTKEAESIVSGNALIAVCDANDNVLWSWHIWATDYDPETDYDEFGGQQVMSRNIGGLASSKDTEDDVWKSYGLFYQWGRKDPFPGPRAWNSTSQLDMYDSKSRAVTMSFKTSSGETGTVDYATAYPTTFIAGVEDSDYDWVFAGRDNDLWSEDEKTLYDPCPVGWRVAPARVWAEFTTTGDSSEEVTEFNVDGGYEYGWMFLDDNDNPTFWPGAGRRTFSNLLASSNRNYTNVIHGEFGDSEDEKTLSVGFYWSSSSATVSGRSSLLAFRSDYVNPGTDTYGELDAETGAWSPEGARAGGFPLRCVKE